MSSVFCNNYCESKKLPKNNRKPFFVPQLIVFNKYWPFEQCNDLILAYLENDLLQCPDGSLSRVVTMLGWDDISVTDISIGGWYVGANISVLAKVLDGEIYRYQYRLDPYRSNPITMLHTLVFIICLPSLVPQLSVHKKGECPSCQDTLQCILNSPVWHITSQPGELQASNSSPKMIVGTRRIKAL